MSIINAKTKPSTSTIPGNAPALQLSDVTVSYPDGDSQLLALNHVDAQLDRGQAVALVGESGSGKSTLLSVAAGLVVPTSGRVQVAGTTLDPDDVEARARVRRQDIGVIFQQPNLLGSLNVREQLLITDELRGTKGRRQRADDMLEFVGLGGLGQRRMQQLSGGQRQRVNIARALMGSPRLLLADEPTSALDRQRSESIMELLLQASRELDIALLVVTHDVNLTQYVDATWEMRDGVLHT